MTIQILNIQINFILIWKPAWKLFNLSWPKIRASNIPQISFFLSTKRRFATWHQRRNADFSSSMADRGVHFILLERHFLSPDWRSYHLSTLVRSQNYQVNRLADSWMRYCHFVTGLTPCSSTRVSTEDQNDRSQNHKYPTYHTRD